MLPDGSWYDVVAQPVFVLDPVGRVTSYNAAARERYPRGEGEAIDAVLGVSSIACEGAMRDARSSTCPAHVRLGPLPSCPDETSVGFATIRALRTDRRRLLGYALRLDDVGTSDFTRLTASLRDANRELFEQQRLRRELDNVRRRMTALLSALPIAEFACDASGRVQSCSPFVCELYRVNEADVIGSRLDRWVRFDAELHTRLAGAAAPRQGALNRGPIGLLQVPGPLYGRGTRKDGTEFPVRFDWASFGGDRGVPVGYVALVSDVTAVQESAQRLERLANTDALTEALNRRHFLELAEAEYERCLRHQRQAMLVMFDLDHFKAINDTHGHEAGDAALRAFASVVRYTSRVSDLFARYGGEEFVALLPEADASAARRFAERVALRLREVRIEGANGTFGFGFSAGVAPLVTEDGGGIADALRIADDAMYEAKRRGRGRVVVYRNAATTTVPRADV